MKCQGLDPTEEKKVTETPDAIDHILLDEAKISARVHELAAQISADYADASEEILLVGVLKGAFIFLSDLARELTVPHHVDFIALSSYNRGSTTGEVRLIMDSRVNVAGHHVLIIEDIVDTGYTLDYLLRTFHARKPASLRSAVFLSKPDRRQIEVPIDYLGFEIPDVWVVGYGLDYDDRFRTLPYIGALKQEVYESGG